MDDFRSLYNRLQSRCPAAGVVLSQQLINDAWRTLQSRREWSWRRRSGAFAAKDLTTAGTATTSGSSGSGNIITGSGTAWTSALVGQQIRIGGYLNPYYTVVSVQSTTQLTINTAWIGPDVAAGSYQILQVYFTAPTDFGYFDVMVSPRDGYRLWTNRTESDLALYDPQRSNQGQPYAAVFRDYQSIWNGLVHAVIPVGATGATPVSSVATSGYTFPASTSYIVQIVVGGASGTATFKWLRLGGSYSSAAATSTAAIALSDGVQIAFPTGTYTTSDLFIINATAGVSAGAPRFEMWPAPTSAALIYPYLYYAKESDITDASPALPPSIASRGEVILEMALASCARYPGTDADHPNPYFNLALATMHETRAERMLNELETNDENVGVTRIEWERYPFYPAPWGDGSWRQNHAPFLE